MNKEVLWLRNEASDSQIEGILKQRDGLISEVSRLRGVKEENEILRELLWIRHGHATELYGDDGEMQCGKCMVEAGFSDFRETPAAEIKERWTMANLKKLMSYMSGVVGGEVEDGNYISKAIKLFSTT